MIKNKFRLLLLTILLLTSASTFGQNVRGFYLTGIGGWLGDATKENNILTYAQGNGYNYIAFYDLGSVNWTSASDKNKLASFMSRARSQYGVIQFGAVVEIYSFVTNYIMPYNNSRTNANEKFDVINLEFEFWVTSSISSSYCSKFLSPNGYSCDTAGAWKFAWKQFKAIDSLCAAQGLISEVYLGWPTKGQMQQLASIADRILLHAYRPTDADVYAYSKNRLMDLASVNATKKVMPIFSGEPPFMGPWLSTHPISKPYQTYASDLSADPGTFKQYINLDGYIWFTYDFMPKTTSATASISANGPLSFCSGGNVSLTANSGTSYLWSPGNQTVQTITVTTPGSYTVRVTNSSGASATSAPAVVSYSNVGAAPTIAANGPTSFCPGGSVILTASQAATYHWSTGQTTQSINVTTSGNYIVTTGSGTCVGTSAPITVNATAAPTTPSVTASGSLNICPGSLLTLTSSTASGYLWSNGATTRSIVVSAAGNYSVNAYSGPNCSAQSAVNTVNVLAVPGIPSIVASSSTTLTPTNPTVTLTSSAAASYLWLSGQTTRAITVSTQGNYRVTITGITGCKAISNRIIVKANGCAPPAEPVINLSGSNVLTGGQSVTLSTSVTGGGYMWSNGATTPTITVSASGNYTVKVFSGPNCYSTSLPVSIVALTLINPDQTPSENNVARMIKNVEGTNSFSLYPNPARDELNIVFSLQNDDKISLKFIDMTGREIQSTEIDGAAGENTYQMNVSDFPKGIYFACMTIAETKKVVKVVVQ